MDWKFWLKDKKNFLILKAFTIFNLNVFDLKIQNLDCSYLFINNNSKIYVIYKFQTRLTKIRKISTIINIIYRDTIYTPIPTIDVAQFYET